MKQSVFSIKTECEGTVSYTPIIFSTREKAQAWVNQRKIRKEEKKAWGFNVTGLSIKYSIIELDIQ